jgi:transcriptional regulator with XRE-family HTH domain
LLFLPIQHSNDHLFMDFKDRFKQARTKKAISQSELAKIVGVHVTNISRYERGENKPTSEVLSKLADALDVSADYLMSGSTDDIATDAISDKELLSQFKKIATLSNEDKKVVKRFLDAFLFKNDIQKKLAS